VDVVIGFGGYASAPAYRAAHRLGLPLVIHEANARPGLANRLGARYTTHVGTVFPETSLRNSQVVGMPLRLEIEQLDRPTRRQEAREFFGLDPDRPTLLVTGWQVLHIAGAGSDLAESPVVGYTIISYCDRMELALAASDLAIARSGSVTVSEFSAVGLPAVFIPYPVGNGEQRLNAADAVRAGGALLVSDAEFTRSWVTGQLLPLLRDPEAITRMSAAIASVGTRDGSDRMVALVLDAESSA
jgi:UDP-N-acetylglucosamine--N-acetylmuramyl-(pentapeptide) pyrophosphoryl-undecaprenol N-acetylglucosamine transferase